MITARLISAGWGLAGRFICSFKSDLVCGKKLACQTWQNFLYTQIQSGPFSLFFFHKAYLNCYIYVQADTPVKCIEVMTFMKQNVSSL